MFQNEMISQKLSVDNNKTSLQQSQTSCQYKCNSILVFIIFGFIFLCFAMIELITNLAESKYIIPLHYHQTDRYTYSESTHMSLKSKSISIYLLFQKVSQYNYTSQYQGKNIQEFDDTAYNCLQYKYNRQINKKYNVEGDLLNQNDYAIPCGYYPSLFPGKEIQITINNKTLQAMKYNTDLHFNYHVSDFNLSKQWVSLKERFFQEWMQQNVHIDVLKLIGNVQQDNIQGELLVKISNLNQLSVNNNERHKMYLIISDNLALGGQNTQFSFITGLSCSIMFLFALIIYLFNKIEQQAKLKNISIRTVQIKANYIQKNSQKHNFT